MSYGPYLLVALVSALATSMLSRWWRAVRLRARFRRGRLGEGRARELLEARGYRVSSAQATRRAHMWIDGARESYDVRADFIASRGWRSYVVEVKTGRIAPDPKGAATRRQLLEYASVYDVDGLLLADMEREQLLEIRFPGRPRAGGGAVAAVLGAFAGGALVTWGGTWLAALR